MKKMTTFLLLVSSLNVFSQTIVNNTSFTFSGGVYPTFSVTFNNADAGMVEKWYKTQLKSISADMGGKKEVMSIGTRLPEISSDTIRVFLKADKPKKSADVYLHAAFRVNGTFVGPDSDARQLEGCKSWMYQHAIMLKKELVQKELETTTKQQTILENELAGFVKEKDRAQNSIEKTQANITEDEQEKAEVEGKSTIMVTTVDAKRQEVANGPTEANTKELQDLLKEQTKLTGKSEKLAKNIESGKKKIENLQYQMKKNLADQDAKGKAIDLQKKLVEEVRTKLAGVN